MADCRLTALLVYLFVLTGGSQGFTVEPAQSELNVPNGEDAVFTVRPSSAIKSGTWVYKGKTIVLWVRTSLDIDVVYKSRVDLDITSGSLTLKSVNESDNGDYTVSVFAVGGAQDTATITLQAFEPVSQPVITSNDTRPVEHNDTVTLECVAVGTDVSYAWSSNGLTLSPGGRLVLSNGNRTLTISGVLRSDKEFTCTGSNPVNTNTSDPFLLDVSYGPESVQISVIPDQAAYTSGTDASLTCSAVSNPAPEYQWLFNGLFQQSGQQLVIAALGVNDTGSYTCQVFNNVTKRSSSSSRNITVIERVANVNLRSNNSEPVEQRDSVVLTCSSRGSQVKREWIFKNQPIQQNDTITISGDTLIIDPVDRADTGMYKCIVSNGLNSGNAETSLNVLYGPDNMKITPQSPVTITNGENLTLTCSAQSMPSPVYEWFNGAEMMGTGPVFTIPSVSMEHGMNYTCHANNARTGRNISLTVNVNVQNNGLGAGAIAGIVIAVVVVGAGGIGGGIAYLMREKRHRPKAEPGTKYDANRSPRGQITSATHSEDGLATYENLPGKDQGTTHAPEGDPTYMGLKLDDRSVYSELRR
ncbi:carcinoembryonic antigen-related cell adhesion molecule 5-like [Amblyraja radiata]|uniref:carcinoembryonic antigen-related cell adhesion molecule 5-like n=1 Tax=Amblyraja radiata TaxID=386614 RepID=UPI0014030EF9|nr:carcinoembryonic antigen-related cell adhesion molecule 5-like [Amblyraja radiata]